MLYHWKNYYHTDDLLLNINIIPKCNDLRHLKNEALSYAIFKIILIKKNFYPNKQLLFQLLTNV